MTRCDACGNTTFFNFGPYDDSRGHREAATVDDHHPGVPLHMIYTCTKCGNQIREYADHSVIDLFTNRRRISLICAQPTSALIHASEGGGNRCG